MALLLCYRKKLLSDQPNLCEPSEPPKKSHVWFGLVWSETVEPSPPICYGARAFHKREVFFSSSKCTLMCWLFFVPFVFSFPLLNRPGIASKHDEGNSVSGCRCASGMTVAARIEVIPLAGSQNLAARRGERGGPLFFLVCVCGGGGGRWRGQFVESRSSAVLSF